ncbi:MAG: DUF2179 domain-containing protein [Bacteroidetes bacterium]|nr:DUF2179 domain-containing protein [Bacteroidota bacterium]
MDASFDYYNWILLPLLIFISRLFDVTLNTLRHIFTSKGYTKIVPILGFFEVLLWLIIVAQVMKNLNNVACYLAWACGFATGTYIGLKIEEKLALGNQIIRLITNQSTSGLIDLLREKNHGVTILSGEGAKGPVKILYIIAERKNVKDVIHIIDKNIEDAFYTIEDIRNSHHGIFASKRA